MMETLQNYAEQGQAIALEWITSPAAYAQFGLLTGIVFTLFYTFVGIILGMLADRFNRPRIIAVGLFVWSAMTSMFLP